jgi:hypothetical protein
MERGIGLASFPFCVRRRIAITGKKFPANRESTGNFLGIDRSPVKIRLENISKFSYLRDEPPEFPAQRNRELIRDNREFIPPLGPEQGIGREIDSRAPLWRARHASVKP